MSKYLIQQIRNCLCIPGKQKPRSDELTDQQLLEVFHRLRRGQNPNEIAIYAQRAWNFMQDRAEHTAGQAIRKLQKRIAHLILEPLETEIPPTGSLSVTAVAPKGLQGHLPLNPASIYTP